MASMRQEIESRRTFAIISHPDAGKTTLTEKLLLYGGAIQQAGSVKGKQSARHAVSDWMEIEKQRGISVTSSVLQFNYAGRCVNILDTPHVMNYHVETYGTDCVFRVRLELGFKCRQQINVYLRQIVSDLQKSGELPDQEKKYSIYGHSTVGNFKFCILRKSVPTKTEALSSLDEFVLKSKYAVRRMVGDRSKWFGLDNSVLMIENVPLIVAPDKQEKPLQRTYGQEV